MLPSFRSLFLEAMEGFYFLTCVNFIYIGALFI